MLAGNSILSSTNTNQKSLLSYQKTIMVIQIGIASFLFSKFHHWVTNDDMTKIEFIFKLNKYLVTFVFTIMFALNFYFVLNDICNSKFDWFQKQVILSATILCNCCLLIYRTDISKSIRNSILLHQQSAPITPFNCHGHGAI